MKTRHQILLSLAIVGLAATSLAIYSAVAPAGDATGRAAEHIHGAAAGGDVLNPVRLDPAVARRIGVTYAAADRRLLERTVTTVGIVTYDETKLFNVNPKIEGWVERLYVDFTGAPIQKGQPLMEVYSPMLVSAQEELILARRLVDKATAGSSERASANARDLLASARQRLSYWDIPDDEIEHIEHTLTPRKTLTLRAGAGGVVVEKNVVEGSRIMPGMDLYKIADLSRVWINSELFEKDIALVRAGQRAAVTFDAYPGEVFRGVVTYVYPSVSLDARTGQVRLELANPGLKFKPGMYAQVEIRSSAPREALLIPRTAVLVTGQRTLVFVQEQNGTLAPRDVQTGLAAGSDVEILSGLEAGDVVVTSANFLIDAESNLGASLGAMAGMDMSRPATGSSNESSTPRSSEPAVGSSTKPHAGSAPSIGETTPTPADPAAHQH